MRNRDKLRQTATYDLLMDLNESIRSRDYYCVLECITGEYQYIDHDRCLTREHDCGKCLQKWINEECGNER
jgi:hypothetical protein